MKVMFDKQFFLPGLEPPEKAAVKHLIYHLNFEMLPEDETVMKIKLQFICNTQVQEQEEVTISEWKHKINGLGCYLATAYRLSSETEKNGEITIENISAYVGKQVWNMIHCMDSSKNVWNEFAKNVEKNARSLSYIIISGSVSSIATPIECVYFNPGLRRIFHDNNVPIIRLFHSQEIDPIKLIDIANNPLPEDIIVLLGHDSETNMYKHALDYYGEIEKWYEILQPDKKVSEEDIRLIISQGSESPISNLEQSCRIHIVPQGDLDYLENKVKKPAGSSIFMYIGHGLYVDYANHKDGHLVIKCKTKRGPYTQEQNAHEELINILCKFKPQGVFLNCCEGLHNIELTSNEGCEFRYFTQIKGLHIFMGFRSKLWDSSGQVISRQLLKSILEGHSIIEFLYELRRQEKVFLNGCEQSNRDIIIRDQVSRVSIIR